MQLWTFLNSSYSFLLSRPERRHVGGDVRLRTFSLQPDVHVGVANAPNHCGAPSSVGADSTPRPTANVLGVAGRQ
jgi:hypothetical protein